MESTTSFLVEKGRSFIKKWLPYCTFKLGAQVEGVPGASVTGLIQQSKSPGGVCEAMCIDWIRRKKPGAGGEIKDSFVSSKHALQTSEEQKAGGQKSHTERMTRKISGHGDTLGYDDIQHIYAKTLQGSSYTTDVEQKQALLVQLTKRAPKFRGLQVREVGVGQRNWIKEGTTGSLLFRAIIHACEEERQNEEVLKLDRISPCYKLSFYVGWKRSHSMALQITYEPGTTGQTGSSTYRIHFLDQSLGEFQFVSPVEVLFYDFCDDMWELNQLMNKHRGDGEWNYWKAFQYYRAEEVG
jgi:hypothetical protein